jgi:hypothetical protein
VAILDVLFKIIRSYTWMLSWHNPCIPNLFWNYFLNLEEKRSLFSLKWRKYIFIEGKMKVS